MGQALYRKYRSRTFDEVVGQDHITKTLQKAIKTGKVSHAYLFTGPRGVGKTSVARILAHEVNNLQNSGEPVHLDIIEIDAASNRRIDEIRDLRERVHIAPAAAKYKVYIIDEVHMLTKEAFNALLKTLEEPPAHVIFILATTEAHKLPETIISRTQRFSFKPITSSDLVKHLERIAKKEGLTISSEALKLIAEHADGSARDSIGLLDQLAANGKVISDTDVQAILGIPKAANVNSLIDYVKNGQSAAIVETLDELRDQGINPAIVSKELSAVLRRQLVDGGASEWSSRLLRQLLNISASPHPQDELEISLLEAASANRSTSNLGVGSAKQASAKIEPPQATIIKKPSVPFDLQIWSALLRELKNDVSPLYSTLRLAKPTFHDGLLSLVFEFPLHQKKLDQLKNKQLIARAVENLTGQKIRIECIVDKSLFKTPKPALVAKKSQNGHENNSLEAISSIFGAAEMLES